MLTVIKRGLNPYSQLALLVFRCVEGRASLPQEQKPPPSPCLTTALNLVATFGPARLLSTSIKGLSATTAALGPLIVQFKVRVLRR
jgi:hypothetical protein